MSWRSLLFVPGDRPELAAKAARSEADAVIVDLEDAVLEEARPRARASLAEMLGTLAAAGKPAMLRINRPLREMARDLEAVDCTALAAVVVPKADEPLPVRAVHEMLTDIAGQAAPPLIALVESPRALPRLERIAASPGLAALMFGTEDYAAEIGVAPDRAVLSVPAALIAAAAAGQGLAAIGLLGSIAELRDMEVFGDSLAAAAALGFRGTGVIHPRQVPVANAAFGPSDREIDEALGVVAAFEAAGAERGAIAHEGRMIDRPVYLRAREVLRRAGEVS